MEVLQGLVFNLQLRLQYEEFPNPLALKSFKNGPLQVIIDSLSYEIDEAIEMGLKCLLILL